MSRLDYYRLVHVPEPSLPDGATNGDPDDVEPEPCVVCGLTPCDCDGIYDRWKDR